jgi:iron complex transport system ATP-binding protein
MGRGIKISTRDLSISYHKKESWVIKNCNLNFDSGKVYSFIGENGIGKSTLLRSIAGMQSFQKGEIIIDGTNINNISASENSKFIAVVLTDSIKHGMLSVFDFVAYGRYPFTNWLGKLKQSDIDIIDESINYCKASHLKGKMLSDLSDGERQKIMISRAIAQQTPVIILDEPTTHLDIRNSKAIFSLLKMLAKEFNKTILFSTHQLEYALKVADELIIHTKKDVEQYLIKDYLNNQELRKLIEGED